MYNATPITYVLWKVKEDGVLYLLRGLFVKNYIKAFVGRNI